MQIVRLIIKEILHRKVHFVLGLLAVVTAVGLFVAFMTTARASNRETARLMLKAGFTLRIIPKETDMNTFLINGFSDQTMPADYVDKIAQQKGFSYNHLLATLQQKVSWRNMAVIVTGLAPETCPPDRKKPPMSFSIKPGTAYAGFVIAEKLGLKEGEIIEINGTALSIVDCLDESGTVDDIRIQCHVADAQAILGLPGRINEIQAVDCLCFTPTDDPLAILRGELAQLLPDAKVIQMSKLAEVRKEQRLLVKNHLSFIMTVVIVVCGVWIGVLAMLNVRQRESEIGIMRAIGYSSGKVVSLLLGKAVVMGVCGAVLGFAAGVALAIHFAPGIFEITAKAIKADYTLLYWSIAAAPVFAAIASFIPVAIAIAQDPADTLRKE